MHNFDKWTVWRTRSQYHFQTVFYVNMSSKWISISLWNQILFTGIFRLKKKTDFEFSGKRIKCQKNRSVSLFAKELRRLQNQSVNFFSFPNRNRTLWIAPIRLRDSSKFLSRSKMPWTTRQWKLGRRISPRKTRWRKRGTRISPRLSLGATRRSRRKKTFTFDRHQHV